MGNRMNDDVMREQQENCNNTGKIEQDDGMKKEKKCGGRKKEAQ